MRIRTIAAALAAPAALAAILLGTAGQASAGVTPASLTAYHQPVRVAYGSVELGSPEQYARFEAVTGLGHNKGFVEYTNFTYADPGSRVWAPSGASEQLTVHALGNVYTHTLNSGLVLKALGNRDVQFTGSGYYNASTSDTWTVKGEVRDVKGVPTVTMTLTYGAWAVPAYSATDTGTIAADGSASGTFKDSAGTTGTWSLPAGSFQTVLNFTAKVQRDAIQVRPRTAEFTFAIPAGHALAGTSVTAQVRGGNHPAWSHEVTGSTPASYPVEGGFIYVP